VQCFLLAVIWRADQYDWADFTSGEIWWCRDNMIIGVANVWGIAFKFVKLAGSVDRAMVFC